MTHETSFTQVAAYALSAALLLMGVAFITIHRKPEGGEGSASEEEFPNEAKFKESMKHRHGRTDA